METVSGFKCFIVCRVSQSKSRGVKFILDLFFFFFFFFFFFMFPTSKKLGGHIASVVFVRLSVLPCIRPSVRSSRFLMHSITLEP